MFSIFFCLSTGTGRAPGTTRTVSPGGRTCPCRRRGLRRRRSAVTSSPSPASLSTWPTRRYSRFVGRCLRTYGLSHGFRDKLIAIYSEVYLSTFFYRRYTRVVGQLCGFLSSVLKVRRAVSTNIPGVNLPMFFWDKLVGIVIEYLVLYFLSSVLEVRRSVSTNIPGVNLPMFFGTNYSYLEL